MYVVVVALTKDLTLKYSEIRPESALPHTTPSFLSIEMSSSFIQTCHFCTLPYLWKRLREGKEYYSRHVHQVAIQVFLAFQEPKRGARKVPENTNTCLSNT